MSLTKGRAIKNTERISSQKFALMNWAMAKEVGLLTYVVRRLAWRVRSRIESGRIPYILPGGRRIALPASSPFASDIYCTDGRVDWGSEELFIAYLAGLEPRGCFYDVGANMGYYSVLLAPHAVSVFAFEPDPRNHADLLAQKIEGLTLVPKAVSDVSGIAHFDISSVSTVGHLSAGKNPDGEIEVECITLDEFRGTRPSNERVAAVKMDVEGYELSCLRGATLLALNERPVFLIEYAVEDGRPNTFSGLGEFVAAHSYDIYAMIRHPGGAFKYRTMLEKTTSEALASQHFKMLFLVPQEIAYFRDRCAGGFCFENTRT